MNVVMRLEGVNREGEGEEEKEASGGRTQAPWRRATQQAREGQAFPL